MKISIIGRPNVGKSALFNRILKHRKAIVAEEEGVTRDRLYQDGEFFGQPFVLIDSGGIDPHSKKDFNQEVIKQAQIAIQEADCLIMVVDGRVGISKLDEIVASMLFKTKKPVLLAINKIDDQGQIEIALNDFYRLGIKKMFAVSALHGLNVAELLEAAFETWKNQSETGLKNQITVEDQTVSKLAIVGRANTGKSTLLNFLLQEERSAVSDIAGTTRDCIDAFVKYQEQTYQLIDTAGIRRKNKEKSVVEKFAHVRTEEAIKNTQVCLLILDAQDGFTEQDQKIMNLIQKLGKGCLILINKWDLVKNFRMEHVLQALLEKHPHLKAYPIVFISAKTGRNIDKIFSMASMVKQSLQQRISTGQLNQFVEKCMQKNHPPMIQGKRLRIYYLTQIKTSPPRFVLFVNKPALMQKSYQKYLISQFRQAYPFLGVPLFFEIKGKNGIK